MSECPDCPTELVNGLCPRCGYDDLFEAESSATVVDMPAARWEENARALLKLALELAYEVKSRCTDPIHDEQIASLRALETEWAGSGHIAAVGTALPDGAAFASADLVGALEAALRSMEEHEEEVNETGGEQLRWAYGNTIGNLQEILPELRRRAPAVKAHRLEPAQPRVTE